MASATDLAANTGTSSRFAGTLNTPTPAATVRDATEGEVAGTTVMIFDTAPRSAPNGGLGRVAESERHADGAPTVSRRVPSSATHAAQMSTALVTVMTWPR
jgi:hypothetical protein